jgi:hypothetical protein
VGDVVHDRPRDRPRASAVPGPRPCLIFRSDKVPVSTSQIALLGDYFGYLLDQFGEEDDATIHRRLMKKLAFVSRLGWLSENNHCEGQAW